MTEAPFDRPHSSSRRDCLAEIIPMRVRAYSHFGGYSQTQCGERNPRCSRFSLNPLPFGMISGTLLENVRF